ncbi:MAG: carotenoid biosynthesis protein [Patescibacteria group bacterium]
MDYLKTNRLAKISFILLVLLICWGFIQSFVAPIGITSFWGIGLGTILAAFYISSLYIKEFGIFKTAVCLATLLALVFGAHVLNQFRGWPFGFVTYNDILGWRLPLNIAWPIPVFWTTIIASGLMLMRPNKNMHDPKTIFAWAFDTGLFVLLSAVIIEPILNITTSQTWSFTGGFYGVPLTGMLGWFLTAFVASYATIYIAKLMDFETTDKHASLSISLLALTSLACLTAYKLSMSFVIVPCVIAILYFTFSLLPAKLQRTGGDGFSPTQE